jgi:hypothetical protein
MATNWRADMPVAQVRIARPTDKLNEVVRFYSEGLGLEVLGSFHGHAGYSGVMLGLPGREYHLEFTQHEKGSPCPAPTRDNLLVLYIPDMRAIEEIKVRLGSLGFHPVPPENPFWQEKSVTIADPDGWRVVLVNTPGL